METSHRYKMKMRENKIIEKVYVEVPVIALI
jgi:hypothetical protein